MYKIQFNKKKNDQSEKNDCHLLITHIIYIKTKILYFYFIYLFIYLLLLLPIVRNLYYWPERGPIGNLIGPLVVLIGFEKSCLPKRRHISVNGVLA